MIEIENNKQKQTNKKKTWLIVGIVFSVFLVIGIISSILKPEQKSDEQSDTPTTISVAIGESFELEGLKITVEGYEFRYYAIDNAFAAGAGKVWLMIKAKIENPNTTRIKYDTITNSLYYITENGEARYNNVYYNYKDWLLASNYLDPYEIANGYFMFSLPENIAPITDGYLSYENGGTSTSVKGKHFEIRFQQNKTNPTNNIKVKL